MKPKKNDLSTQRNIAKIGMALSMGTLVYTGFRGKEAATLHIGAGLALVGFSFWHYRLYQPKTTNRGSRR
ncbi:hypothetical protein DENIS_4508 [Desulfonema ishimotonii]|uniref:Uncharacterized protein n=1 Tax=Desulfonema ishimotonii TaxID=45657 RepID=A0A401G2R3_9BACT|nr:hypothetical protein DENIS_4508 [Desulfonema ishimotonii]